MKICLCFLIISFTWMTPGCFAQGHSFEKVSQGILSEEDFTKLKEILAGASPLPLRDTLIIKYDYNNGTCWDMLDKQTDDYVTEVISGSQKRIQQVMLNRKQLSVFRFRQPGKNFNKIISWDGTIITDKGKRLFRLLFKKRDACGNSVIISPDRKFTLILSDPHFIALER